MGFYNTRLRLRAAPHSRANTETDTSDKLSNDQKVLWAVAEETVKG